MPYLSKNALSQFIRTECKKQLRLNLSPDNDEYSQERQNANMPQVQPPRPGLDHIRRAGDQWEAEKQQDLIEAFGDRVIRRVVTNSRGQNVVQEIDLISALENIQPYSFILQADFTVGPALENALQIEDYRDRYNLRYAHLRPDIIIVVPPTDRPAREVFPSGEVVPIPGEDNRLRLKVIDVKLTAEPSPNYFAEIAYYSMALAGWLRDNNLDNEFLVLSEAAIWPGKHDASELSKTLNEFRIHGRDIANLDLFEALLNDLEEIPFEVFAFRVRRFFTNLIPQVLSVNWDELEYHVDSRCKGCEYLGYHWIDQAGNPTWVDDHCMPSASTQDHLSRIAFMSRGASAVLHGMHIERVSDLAQLTPDNHIFDGHQVLRSTRTVISGRVQSLLSNQSHIPIDSGTSAIMPKWSDLSIYLSADFDLGSAITFCFGLKAFWIEPRPFGSIDTTPRQHQTWGPRTFPILSRDISIESRELQRFLIEIDEILSAALARDPNTTLQFYIWDKVTYDHISRVIGRHLQSVLVNPRIRHLAWLFPSEELLPNPELTTRKSPITVINDVVRSVLALPIPHYYSMLQTARVYHPDDLPDNIASFKVHPLFEDVLSDQIPSERAHEIWSQQVSPRYWRDQLSVLEETIRKRLSALEAVTRRLQTELRPTLGQIAPRINIQAIQPQARISSDGQLWYAFSKLDATLSEIEVATIRSMPPHEREARFHSARLQYRLRGEEEQAARILLNLVTNTHPRLRIYRLRDTSREVKIREKDFNVAIMPEAFNGFLERSLFSVVNGTTLQARYANGFGITMDEVVGVTVLAINREHNLIAFIPNTRYPNALDDLENAGIIDLSVNAILDPIHHDFFTRKLLKSLRDIGNPPGAVANPLVARALGPDPRPRGPRQTNWLPPADLLWNPTSLNSTVDDRNLDQVRAFLEQVGIRLNDTQWTAWQEAMTRRLQLIWGPPGTGKSKTAEAIILGVIQEARQMNRNLRVLVCASTYTALDTVFLPVYKRYTAHVDTSIPFYRLRSYLMPRESHIPVAIDVELNRWNPSQLVRTLKTQLLTNGSITVVGGTPEQVHNLLTVDDNPAVADLFDIILIDEASQMDVPHAILALCSLATNGRVILAGDPKQLPPIHQAEAPLGLENMVGSIYEFYSTYHKIPAVMLNRNYRSNETIVNFGLLAGYQSSLVSHSPGLRLNLASEVSTNIPRDWPATLYWTPNWVSLLNPHQPVSCFVYGEGRSSQWNVFEADAVCAMIQLLNGRLRGQLLGELDFDGNPVSENVELLTQELFWKKAVGIVTPHRAQQGLIVSKLQNLYSNAGVESSWIRGAVDTVERFQGQQRQIIIATFALGDPDAIQTEDEFLMSLNRFNVMASRARAKLIVLISQEVVDHLSSDIDTLRESRLLKTYVESYCNQSEQIILGYRENGETYSVNGMHKYRF